MGRMIVLAIGGALEWSAAWLLQLPRGWWSIAPDSIGITVGIIGLIMVLVVTTLTAYNLVRGRAIEPERRDRAPLVTRLQCLFSPPSAPALRSVPSKEVKPKKDIDELAERLVAGEIRGDELRELFRTRRARIHRR